MPNAHRSVLPGLSIRKARGVTCGMRALWPKLRGKARERACGSKSSAAGVNYFRSPAGEPAPLPRMLTRMVQAGTYVNRQESFKCSRAERFQEIATRCFTEPSWSSDICEPRRANNLRDQSMRLPSVSTRLEFSEDHGRLVRRDEQDLCISMVIPLATAPHAC